MRGWKLFLLVLLAPIAYVVLVVMKEEIQEDLYDGRPSDAKFTVEGSFPMAIDQFRLSYKRLPRSLDELWSMGEKNEIPFLRPTPNDPWGNPFKYSVLGMHDYEIRSDGPDGRPGTSDDIVFRRD